VTKSRKHQLFDKEKDKNVRSFTLMGWMRITDSKNESKNAVNHEMDLSRPHSKL